MGINKMLFDFDDYVINSKGEILQLESIDEDGDYFFRDIKTKTSSVYERDGDSLSLINVFITAFIKKDSKITKEENPEYFL